MTTTTFATASLADIRSFLAANNAEAGLASVMKFDGWKMADARGYADRVQALREAGFTAAITPRTVAAAEQQVADERAAAEAERVAAEAATAAELLAMVEAQVARSTSKRARKPAKADGEASGNRVRVSSLADALRALLAEKPVVVLTVADRMAMGLSSSAVNHRAYWAPCNPGGKAAAAIGAKVSSAKADDGFNVVISAAA
jgi:hypothetical protein